MGKCKRHLTTEHQVREQVQETSSNVASSRWASARDILQRSIKFVSKRKRHLTTEHQHSGQVQETSYNVAASRCSMTYVWTWMRCKRAYSNVASRVCVCVCGRANDVIIPPHPTHPTPSMHDKTREAEACTSGSKENWQILGGRNHRRWLKQDKLR